VPTPRAICPWPDRPARLTIKNPAGDAKDRIDWKWQSAAPLGPLGNPLTVDGFTLCVYDNSPAPGLLYRSVVSGGGQCGSRPCWKASRTGSGFVYKDRSASHDGTRAFEVLSGKPRGSRVEYGGQGAGLSTGRPAPLPSLPLPTSLYVQLQADGGACVSARYEPEGVKKNDPVSGTYRANSRMSTLSLIHFTAPSPIAKLAPPGWNEYGSLVPTEL
jgi:hypothetical protein